MLVRSTGAKDLGGSVWVEVKFQGGYLDVPLGLLGSMVMGSVGYNPKDPNIQTNPLILTSQDILAQAQATEKHQSCTG